MRRHKPNLRISLLVLVVVLAMVAAACGSDDASADENLPTIVVTTSIWGDVVENLVGDDANVEVIIPIGADAHDFSPSSQQVAAIQTADLVVANGLGLEEGLEDVLEAAAADGVNVLEVAPLVHPIPFGLDDEHSDEDHSDEEGEHSDEDHSDEEGEHADEHAHDGDDPHVWMDPDRVALAALEIAEALTALDGTIDWMGRAVSYSDELKKAGVEAEEMLAVVAADQRKLVTNHEALGYFADRFDFEVVGVVFPGGSTLSDPSSAELAELVETMENEGVSTIFGESSSPSTLADAVAAEVGDEVQVVELYTESLGEPGSGADTVIGMTLTNAERVAESLGG
ncbi:MAG: metal ABC transporter solute-binding protein, Zn/Mn family [Acidimicrobiia bacterium]